MPSPETSLPPLVLLPVVRKTAPDESCVHNAITYIYTHNPTLISKIAECERLSNDEANYPVARKILDELIQYLRDVVSSHLEIADAIVLAGIPTLTNSGGAEGMIAIRAFLRPEEREDFRFQQAA